MSDLLFEIGFEEFPPSFIRPAAEHLRSQMVEKMTAARITPTSVEVFSTCSRIALKLGGFPAIQPELREKVQGAPKKVALTADGKLGKAGEAFLKKYHLTEYTFEQSADGKGELITGWHVEPGRPVNDIIVETLETLLNTMPFPKSMRWGDGDLQFARPIRWLLCLIDDKPVERSFHGIAYAKNSFGHRFMAPGAVPVTFGTYAESLKKASVIVEHEKRVALIRAEVQRIARDLKGNDGVDEELVEEVANMTEFPVAVVGAIPAKYADLPPELITLVLKENQRYFTIYRADRHELLPQFISFLNNAPTDPKVVVKGCEKVVAARMADAAFYYYDDRKKDFKGLTDKLAGMLFQKELGSYRDKAGRTAELAKFIATKYFGVKPPDANAMTQAALLIKNDLITGVVFEFPELQGTMGRYYAANAGYDAVTAQALEEHYLPRFSGDRLPATVMGAVLALADKTDTIVGGFMAGMKPTGAKDKFAIRRNAIGLLQIAAERGIALDLEELFAHAAGLVTAHNAKLKLDAADLADFMKQRYYAIFPYETPVVKSAVEAGYRIPAEVKRRADTIAKLVEERDILEMAQLFKRSGNILKNAKEGEGTHIDEKKLTAAEEKELFAALAKVKKEVEHTKDDLTAAHAIISLKPLIDRFFDKVLVMDEDPAVRGNRIALIRDIVTLVTARIGDISWLGV
ncbi:MAG TPA: glycine--tRNA ligase subunit beta [bacterium]|nr:glycine--tRNA ligase subunit beta [bacterium]